MKETQIFVTATMELYSDYDEVRNSTQDPF